MASRSVRQAAWGVAAVMCVAALAPVAAHGEDFLSALFGAFAGLRPRAPAIPLPFATEGEPFAPPNEIHP
ncbi:MAG TPA: hypothetical protein VG274_07460, partial [Rhizomicrobium sp.]|nr:hypothetical protein [Rhizomicrobium sp.]